MVHKQTQNLMIGEYGAMEVEDSPELGMLLCSQLES